MKKKQAIQQDKGLNDLASVLYNLNQDSVVLPYKISFF